MIPLVCSVNGLDLLARNAGLRRGSSAAVVEDPCRDWLLLVYGDLKVDEAERFGLRLVCVNCGW